MQQESQLTHVCPLCGHTAQTQKDVYVHLQLNHRKSEVCDALVELTDDDTEEAISLRHQQPPSTR